MTARTHHRRAFLRPLALVGVLAALLVMAGEAEPAHATTITVTKTADTNDGVCDADCSLREAIAAAISGDTIDIPAGTYTLTLGSVSPCCSRLTINKDLTLTGAGAATTIIEAATSPGVAGFRVFRIPGGTVVISGVTIRHGSVGAGNSGGGIHNSTTLTLTNSIVRNNSAGSNSGGIRNLNGTLTVINSTVSDNTSFAGGGITNAPLGTLTLTNSNVSNNAANFRGGGILNDGALTLNNSTVSGNHTLQIDGEGGGIFNGGTLTLNSSTVGGNSADFGGGISNDAGTATLKNTIVANSTAGGDCFGDVPTSAGHNLDSDGTCGLTGTGDLSSATPLLGPLADNGGPTQTHALLAGSPAIDAASGDCPPPATDQRGVARPQGAACDIGAFELGVFVTSTADVIADDGVCTLREAITAANTDTASGATAGECAAGSGADTIDLPAVTFFLSIPGVGEDANATGDLDITNDLSINGAGAGMTIIDGAGLDRVFHIVGGTVGISGVTIRNGSEPPVDLGGGGIFNRGTLTLNSSTVSGNVAQVFGGGIHNDSSGTLTLNSSTVSGNGVPVVGGGGGIFNRGTLTLNSSTVSGNTSSAPGGGIWSVGGTVTITNSTVSGNTSLHQGGGIENGGTTSTMTLTNSTVSGNTGSVRGGGIVNRGTLILADSIVSGNTTTFIGGEGGGIHNNGTATITNSTVSGNTAVHQGGGIRNLGTMTLTNSTVSDNTSQGSGGAGGIYNAGTLEINSSTVSGNTAGGSGGGVFQDIGTLTLNSATVSGNTANDGGGILNAFGTVTLNNSTVSGNSTAIFGGGIRNLGSGTLTLNSSTVSGNTSTNASGGGIYNSGTLALNSSSVSGNSAAGGGGGGIFNEGTLTLNNSTVSGNTANDGGGITNSGTLTLNNSTVSSNSAAGGGGMFNSGASGSITLKNTIVANNTNGDCSGNIITSAGHNLIEVNNCTMIGDSTGNIIGSDPLLGQLQNNGGPTETHALLAGSPAIDAGSPDCPPPATDQRGVARPQGTICDIGAFELGVFTISATAGANGSIAPSGLVTVDEGGNQTFTITPDVNFHVSDVFVRSWTPSQIVDIPVVVQSYEGGCISAFRLTGEFAGASFTRGVNYEIALDESRAELALFVSGERVGSVSVGQFGTSTVITVMPENASSFLVTFNELGCIISGTVFSLISETAGLRKLAEGIVATSVGAVTTHTFSNVTANHTIDASFAIDTHSLAVTRAGAGTGTILSLPQGIDCGSDCAEQHEHGAEVTLIALPDEGSTFTGWSGACTGTGICAVTMDVDRSVTATFVTPRTYTITATAGENGTITPLGLLSVAEGGNQTFTIIPDTGHRVADVLVGTVLTPTLETVRIVNLYEGGCISAFRLIGEFAGASFTRGGVDYEIALDESMTELALFVSGERVGSVSVGQFGTSTVITVMPENASSFLVTFNELGCIISGTVFSFITESFGVPEETVSSVGAVNSHTFADVVANHTIHATFELDPDSDGDGVLDADDACPATPGPAERQGCPVGDANTVTLHTIDQQKSAACPGGKGSCKSPIEGAEVRVFDRNDGGFQTAYGTKNPSGSIYDQVFENDIGRVGACTTDASGQCTAGEEITGDYLVIVKYVDPSNKTVYTGKPKSPEDFDATGLASKDFQVIKVLKRNGDIQISGGSKTVVTGSYLEVVHPDFAIWEDVAAGYVYPFIFTSDSDWTVDVCAYVPTGYAIVGVYDANGDLLTDSSCTQTFVSGETKVAAFDVIEVGSPEPVLGVLLTVEHEGKVTEVDVEVPGERAYVEEPAVQPAELPTTRAGESGDGTPIWPIVAALAGVSVMLLGGAVIWRRRRT